MAVTVHPDLTAFDRLKTRIQGLRSKTMDNGCTEAEALLAAAKVAELLDRYDLSLTDVEIRNGECEQRHYSYCVIELEWRGWFCAVRYSTDIVPRWLRERRSGVGASSRLSWQHVVRGERAAPRDGRFWEISGVAN